MRMKVTSLLAAVLLAGACSYAVAQGTGSGAAAGAGSDIATPRANPGPGGTAKPNGAMTTRMVHYKKRHHRHHRHHHRHM